ncbi:MAG: hypothetical protein ACTHML_04310 [Ginsengibacter sp.]|jgi:hypothetical protein
MKTSLVFFALLFIFSSCKKDNAPKDNPSNETYVNTNAGSTWTYRQTDMADNNSTSDYTITSTANDTTIDSRKYHVYTYSYGGSKYLGIEGHDYYQYDSIPITGGVNIQRLYLKDNAAKDDTWKQDFNLQIQELQGATIQLTVQNKVVEKGITKTVNGKDYSNVYHVSTSLSSSAIPSTALASTIDSYYAPGYGLIENTTQVELNYLGLVKEVNFKTELTSTDLK